MIFINYFRACVLEVQMHLKKRKTVGKVFCVSMLTCLGALVPDQQGHFKIGVDDGQYLKYQKIKMVNKDVSGHILFIYF